MFNRKIIVERRNPWRTVRPRRFVDNYMTHNSSNVTKNLMLTMSFSIGAASD